MENLDRFDLRILAELQKDSRISNQELAERIGLSPSPCSRRVKQLEDEGYITKQVALLDRKRLGLTLTAYILIGMDRHTPERFENFQHNVLQWPEVLECSLITGYGALSTVFIKQTHPRRGRNQRTLEFRTKPCLAQHQPTFRSSA